MPPDLGQFQVLIRGCKPLPQGGYLLTIEICRPSTEKKTAGLAECTPSCKEGHTRKAVPA